MVDNLQMSHSLGQYGLHDLYRMMVQHEDIIAGEKKKNNSLALIAMSKTSTHSRRSTSRRVENTDDEPVIELESDEFDEELKKLTNSMLMFARDISKFKEKKGLQKYRPKRRSEAPYRQKERFEDRYQQPEKHNDRYRPTERHDNRYCPAERHDDRYSSTERHDDLYRPTERHDYRYRPTKRYDDRYMVYSACYVLTKHSLTHR